jgi:hypothetical protein
MKIERGLMMIHDSNNDVRRFEAMKNALFFDHPPPSRKVRFRRGGRTLERQRRQGNQNES